MKACSLWQRTMMIFFSLSSTSSTLSAAQLILARVCLPNFNEGRLSSLISVASKSSLQITLECTLNSLAHMDGTH